MTNDEADKLAEGLEHRVRSIQVGLTAGMAEVAALAEDIAKLRRWLKTRRPEA